MSYLSKLMFPGMFTGIVAGTLIYTNRNSAYENIGLINSTYKAYRLDTNEWLRHGSNPKSVELVAKRQSKDKEWYESEVQKQKDWLATPLYKQVIPPTFPDLMGPD